MIDICEVLLAAKKDGSSDIYLKAGLVPRARKQGVISAIPYPALTMDDMLECLLKITNAEQRNVVEEKGEICFSFECNAKDRYRVTVFKSCGVVSMVFHVVPSLEDILQGAKKQQEMIRELSGKKRGLVLFAGDAGDGRSSSIAAVVNEINQNNPVHIMTLESPVETVHNSAMALINQREAGEDFSDPVSAVEGALKEQVDVLVYDGILDRELFTKLCQLSRTGRLVLASTYGKTLSEVVGNVTAFYPPEEKDEVRKNLSEVLQAVVLCGLTVESGNSCQCWEVVSVDTQVKNQIRNCIS